MSLASSTLLHEYTSLKGCAALHSSGAHNNVVGATGRPLHVCTLKIGLPASSPRSRSSSHWLCWSANSLQQTIPAGPFLMGSAEVVYAVQTAKQRLMAESTTSATKQTHDTSGAA